MKAQYDPEQVTHPFHVARQAALIGGASAIPGTIVGAFFGTLRTQTPALFSIVSGAQWFAIGTTFWSVRASILNHTGLRNWFNLTRGAPLLPRDDLTPSPSDKIRASTVSGAFTGLSLGLLFRGPRNVIPGTIMFSLFGWGGQHGYNYLDKRNTEQVYQKTEMEGDRGAKEKETLMQRFAKSKWSPMTVLTDEEYEKMMNERLLKVEVEIALIDERIQGLREKAEELEAQKQEQEKK